MVRKLRWAVVIAGVLALGCHPQEVKQSGTIGSNAQVGQVRLRNVHLVQTEDAYRRGEPAIVALALRNDAPQPDALINVRSPQAAEVDMFWDRQCDGRAEPTERISLLPEASVPTTGQQRPGGTPYYLKISGFSSLARPGTTFPLTFTFERAGTITVDAKVQPVGPRDVRPPPACGARPSPAPTEEPNPPAEREITVRGTVRLGDRPGCVLLENGSRAYLLINGDPNVVQPGAHLVVRGKPQPGGPTSCRDYGMPLHVIDAVPR